MNAPTGRFVTFEGIEGVGKSTQVERARTALATAGREVVTTRECTARSRCRPRPSCS
jgi:dTMP kinase